MSAADREVFTEALRLLRTEGWCTKDFGISGEPKCLAGAIGCAQRDGMRPRKDWPASFCDSDVERLWQAAAATAARLFPGRVSSHYEYMTIFWFNDDERTTQEDVELVLKHLIEETAS